MNYEIFEEDREGILKCLKLLHCTVTGNRKNCIMFHIDGSENTVVLGESPRYGWHFTVKGKGDTYGDFDNLFDAFTFLTASIREHSDWF